MRWALLLLACVLSIVVAGAYALQQKRLLSVEAFRAALSWEEQKTEAPQPAAPLGAAASLREKGKQLEQQRQEANRLDERLKQQKNELKLEMAKLDRRLKTLKGDSESQIAASASEQRMVELVKIYEGMEPEGSASILERLPDETVAEILLQMRRRQASQVMESLSIEKGVAVSARILPDVNDIIN